MGQNQRLTPSQSCRLWARRGAPSERVAVAVAALSLAGLLAWALSAAATGNAGHPLAATGTPEARAGAAAPSAAGGAMAPAATVAGSAAARQSQVGRSGVPATGAGGSGAAASLQPRCLAATGARGVTATELKVAITLINIVGPAGNQTFGIPSADDERADYDAMIDDINKSGGIACRKVVPTYYEVNPVDNNDLHQKCLDIVQAQPFVALDGGGESAVPECFGQNRMPFMASGGLLTEKQIDDFYPYLFTAFTTYDSLYRTTVFALRDRGYFSAANGFGKLGVIYKSCWPDVISKFMSLLKQVGVTSSQLVTYDVGCQTGFSNPSDLQQAILKFRTSNVTHVTTAGDFVGDFANFTTIAQQQGFKPKYGLADDTLVLTSYGSQRPDPNNLDGAVAITASRYGEERTPGMAPTPGTARCDAILRSHGRPGLFERFAAVGAECDQIWMLKAAVEHSPQLSKEALAAGLQAAKSVEFSYPLGPNDFSAPGVTYGGQQWRPLLFSASCACWQVTDRTFRPGYR